MTKPGVLVGCCGFREAQARYFQHFPVIEIQASFYEMPGPALAAKWRAAAPPGFQFCMKAWQLITHRSSSPTYRRLKSKLSPSEADLFGDFQPAEQVWLAWERTLEFAHALQAAVVLFQCPRSFHPTPGNLRNFREFFERIRGTPHALAWEPRGPWPAGLVRELCAEFNLLHCVDPFNGESVFGDTVYWRLHGRGGYRYVYPDSELEWLKQQLEASIDSGRGPVYVLFNNLAMSADALRFQQMIEVY